MKALFLIYFAVVSAFAIIITIIDKLNAKKHRRRISEDFLLTVGLIGGALAEFVTMKAIRHKTRHKKFMLGLPFVILLHIILILLITLFKEGYI